MNSNMNTSVVQGLEEQLEDAKKLRDRRDLAIRLSSNRDFRKLIMEGFCLHDCASFAQQSGDPSLTAEQRADALGMAQAAGHLRRFMSSCFQMGQVAERDLPTIEAELAEARAEEDAAAQEVEA